MTPIPFANVKPWSLLTFTFEVQFLDEIKACLIHGDAKRKVVVSFSVCTGARIGETCQVSSECVQLIKDYINGRTTGCLFEGEQPGTHLTSGALYLVIGPEKTAPLLIGEV